jgi:ankyrin repeat protein
MLQLLIAAGADPHAVTGRGSNACHAAVDVNGSAANSEESVRSTFGFLHQLGVSINCRDLDGSTPLLRARAHGTSTEVRILRELGAR